MDTRLFRAIIALIVFLASQSAFGAEGNPNGQDAKKGRFSMIEDKCGNCGEARRSFGNDDPYIVFQQGQPIKFTPSIQSGATVTFDYGDVDSQAFDPKKPTIHLYTVPGRYTVTMTSAETQAANKEGTVSKATATVHIFDAEIARNGVCRESQTAPDNVLMQYDEHALMAMITLLREDRGRREEVSRRVQTLVQELKTAEQINDDAIRFNAVSRLANRLEEMATCATQKDHKDEAFYLQTMKSAVSRLGNISKNPEDRGKNKAEKDIDRLKDMILGLEERTIKRCDQVIARAESRLKKKGNELAKIYGSVEKTKENKDVAAEPRAGIEKQTSEQRALLNEITRVTPIGYNELFQTYDDYDRYFFKFYFGYELGTSIDDLLKNGAPRIGFSVQYRAWEHAVPDDWPRTFWQGFGIYGLHSTFQALITSSAEQKTIIDLELNTGPTPTVTNTDKKNALEGDVDIFLPVYRTLRFNNKALWGYFGPVASIGLKKVDDLMTSSGQKVDRFDRRYYGGFMLAFNPELYTEVLYGKTTGLASHRLEVRAQMPIFNFNNKSRLLIGAIANVGVKNRLPAEADIVRLYLTWNVEFNVLYKYLSGGKEISSVSN